MDINYIYYDSVFSTNDTLIKLAKEGAPEGTVVIAGEQSGGRGRMGRSFHSPAKTGIYFSILLKPSGDFSHLTPSAALAVCFAAEKYGIKCGIKWVNDVIVCGRKVCGILTESSFDGDKAEYAVVGIGINLNDPEGGFPKDISDIAGALFGSRSGPDPVAFAKEVTGELIRLYSIGGDSKDYKNRCVSLGRDVVVINGDERKNAKALDIDEKYRLEVEYEDGKTEYLSSGEVSVKW